MRRTRIIGIVMALMIGLLAGLAWAGDIHDAVRDGKLDKVQAALEAAPESLEEQDFIGTALHIAASFNHKDIITYLLDQGAQVNGRTADGWAPLHFAVAGGYVEAATIFLDRGADINAVAGNGVGTPLHRAAYRGNPELVKLLLERGSDLNALTEDRGLMPIHVAAWRGNQEVIGLLLEHGANLASKTTDGKNALFFAAAGAHKDLIEKFLGQGLRADDKSDLGETALNDALAAGDTTSVRLLIEAGADVNACHEYYRNYPILIAAKNGDKSLYDLLIEKGARTDVTDVFDNDLLHAAAAGGMIDLAKSLVEQGYDVNAANKLGQTPLHLAILNVHPNTAQELINLGADFNIRDNNGRTPLSLTGGEWRLKWLARWMKQKGAVE